MGAELIEIHGDLFRAEGVYGLRIPNIHIVHCVSSDYVLGAGIAKEIERRYQVRTPLKIHGRGVYPDCLVVNNIINMVTKDKCWNKPRIEDFDMALRMVSSYCVANGITQLIMPRIGCGLDKLNWSTNKELINKYLVDVGINVRVYWQ